MLSLFCNLCSVVLAAALVIIHTGFKSLYGTQQVIYSYTYSIQFTVEINHEANGLFFLVSASSGVCNHSAKMLLKLVCPVVKGVRGLSYVLVCRARVQSRDVMNA